MAGIVDLLLPALPHPEELAVLERVLRRIALEFGGALEGTQLKHLVDFEQCLTRATRLPLAELRAQDAYRAIVDAVREDLGAIACDLYIARDGRVRLHTTTRRAALTDAERAELWVEPHDGSEPLGACLLTRQPRLAHTAQAPPTWRHLGPGLARLLAREGRRECMVVPLSLDGRELWGLLAVCGARLPSRQVGRVPQTSGHFDAWHLRHLASIGVFVQQAAAMAEAAERQSWLVEEMQHSIGHPLQVLRGTTEEMVRELWQLSAPVRAFREELDDAFELVHAARERVAAVGKMIQDIGGTPESTSINELVRSCCRVMQPAARAKGCRIDTSRVEALAPLPVQQAYLRVAVLNLLDNAIKYSYRDARPVDVALSELRGTVTLTISNHGIGIPAADVDRIFDAYFRSNVKDRVAPRPGSGIGLAMVKHAVERIHAGKVSATSRPPRDTPVGDTAADIADIPHTTTFTVILNRADLEKMWAEPKEPSDHA